MHKLTDKKTDEKNSNEFFFHFCYDYTVIARHHVIKVHAH